MEENGLFGSFVVPKLEFTPGHLSWSGPRSAVCRNGIPANIKPGSSRCVISVVNVVGEVECVIAAVIRRVYSYVVTGDEARFEVDYDEEKLIVSSPVEVTPPMIDLHLSEDGGLMALLFAGDATTGEDWLRTKYGRGFSHGEKFYHYQGMREVMMVTYGKITRTLVRRLIVFGAIDDVVPADESAAFRDEVMEVFFPEKK